jgi:hypothetical protein
LASWDEFALGRMERRFAMEAKSFSFLAKADKPELRLEEKRKGFTGSFSLSLQCSNWPADMVEEVLKSQGTEVFNKLFQENEMILKIHKGCNKAGRFLVAEAFVEGGRKGAIWLPEGCEGWGWRRFVDELRNFLVFFEAKKGPGGISTISSNRTYAAVLSKDSGGVESADRQIQTGVVLSWLRVVRGRRGEAIRRRSWLGLCAHWRRFWKILGLTWIGLGFKPKPWFKGSRVPSLWKKLLEKLGSDLDRACSRMGPSPSFLLGLD